MKSNNIEKLNNYTKQFLLGEIDGLLFEKQFTEIFDLEDLEENKQDELKYLEKIRALLECYTSDIKDLIKFSDYYIDEVELKKRILALNTSSV